MKVEYMTVQMEKKDARRWASAAGTWYRQRCL